MGNLKVRLEKKKRKMNSKDLKPKGEEGNKTIVVAEKMKRRREKKKDVFADKYIKINKGKLKKEESENKDKTRKKKRKSADKSDEGAEQTLRDNFNGQSQDAIESEIRARKPKKSKKKKEHDTLKGQERKKEVDQEEIYDISSGDEDSSKGMKKWLTEYHQRRIGLKVLQERIDEFIIAHDEKLEQERKEREARAAEDGWTVVVHHKGRKKTTDSETGITVGSVAQAVVEDRMAKKKRKEVGLDFYRFQRREARRNEILILQSKFEQDKKRIQQLRAARKFRPY